MSDGTHEFTSLLSENGIKLRHFETIFLSRYIRDTFCLYENDITKSGAQKMSNSLKEQLQRSLKMTHQ